MTTILAIDDEPAICHAFSRFLEKRGRRTATAATVAAGLELARRLRPDLIFLDVSLPDGNGLDLLAVLNREFPETPVVVITAHGTLDTAVRAISGKAFEYLIKPLDLDRAWDVVQRAEAVQAATPAADAPVVGDDAAAYFGLVGRAPAIQEVYKRIGQAAAADSGVLILGETGTGKELAARAIHGLSPRRDGPFIAVNCGAIPETLVESELFGHVRGAFTGAAADRPGRFEQADGGTLFLDEIGDLPAAAQVKLLRFLDTRQTERLGSAETRTVDARILAATNRDLEADVTDGRFRADLFYRLSVLRVRMPPLRERREDIPLLARHFLRRSAGGEPTPGFTDAALAALTARDWPGNVRELRNAVEHARVTAGRCPILPEHFAVLAGAPAGAADNTPDDPLQDWVARVVTANPDAPYETALRQVERELLRQALAAENGNQSAAARRLGLHRNTFARKLQEHNLEPAP